MMVSVLFVANGSVVSSAIMGMGGGGCGGMLSVGDGKIVGTGGGNAAGASLTLVSPSAGLSVSHPWTTAHLRNAL